MYALCTEKLYIFLTKDEDLLYFYSSSLHFSQNSHLQGPSRKENMVK